MLTKDGWKNFEETIGWREVVETVKERMKLINHDLLNPETFRSLAIDEKNEKRAELQVEYATCLWFINLPKYDVIKEETDNEKGDRTMAPDLEPFRK